MTCGVDLPFVKAKKDKTKRAWRGRKSSGLKINWFRGLKLWKLMRASWRVIVMPNKTRATGPSTRRERKLLESYQNWMISVGREKNLTSSSVEERLGNPDASSTFDLVTNLFDTNDVNIIGRNLFYKNLVNEHFPEQIASGVYLFFRLKFYCKLFLNKNTLI